jgi:ABC-type sugar transport system ATPase subunit
MLSITNLNQYYGGSHILRNVAFDVPDGTCTTLLGRNGVGKTTLLKCLMGLLPVRSGNVKLDNRSIGSLPPYARAALGIGYVPQGREIFPRLTVGENLQMGLATQKRGAGVPSFIFEMSKKNADAARRPWWAAAAFRYRRASRLRSARPRRTHKASSRVIKDRGDPSSPAAANGDPVGRTVLRSRNRLADR